MEGNETETETALREVYEETNLKIELIGGFRTTTEYFMPTKEAVKLVVYFLGRFENQNVVYQREELSGACLVSYFDAMEMLQFENSKRILKEANDYLLNNFN